MKTILLAALVVFGAGGALAQAPAKPAGPVVLCDSCGTVQHVTQEKRKGKGGAAGVVGGAVVGGLLGNQIGGGTGKTLATVGGAVAGGYAGNEVQKNVTSKTVWVTRVRMKDGSVRTFEQEAKPTWAAGSVVKATGHTLHKY
jgi:outer membrane lipoprotein SlyB